jgi:polar amino acid transport system substrate-binding protein
MPGTGTKDGALVGIDGEIMTWVANRLGLTVEPQLMEWAAEIESVKSRRVDTMHGMMGWNQPRTEVITITDPIYYAGALMTQKKGAGITKLDQLKDKRVATIQGFGWVQELQSINPDLKLYDTSDAAIRDLSAGRVDVLFADPPLIQYVATQQPDLDIESIPVTDPYDPALVTLTGKYQVVFGMSKEAPKLEKCINDAIAELWKSCENYKIAAKYGFDDKYWFTPPTENPRVGIDRDENWKYPELGSCPQ